MTLACVGRLAPSPTGAQHLGNARTFLLAWLSARSQRGKCIFRMEDLDSPRVKAEAIQQAILDLRWLGLNWDEGPDIGGPHEPYTQTLRLHYYYEALERLKARELVYPCTCSRADIDQAASAPQANHTSMAQSDVNNPLRHLAFESPPYPGTCSGRSVADAERFDASEFSWRFRFPNNIRSYQDGFVGDIQLNAAAVLGDFLVSARGQVPAYQLAVVVDDYRMGITEVVRGDDLVPSTFRQLALYDALSWPPPQFIHTPLVVGMDGRRLAKRHGDTRLATLRERGVAPNEVIGFLAYRSGLTDHPAAVSAAELLPHFHFRHVSRHPVAISDDDVKFSRR